jgi:hypothetical protein
MALAETTLAAACGQSDTEITVAAATSITAGRIFQVDGEAMQATKGYVTASVTVPVTRGLGGTAQVAHLNTARVVHGDAADWGNTGAGAISVFAPVGRTRRIRSYRTTASMDLPAAGEDMVVRLDSTAFTLTVPVPTKELDGCEVTFVGSAAGVAYVLEFTGGLGGASTNYETVTFNGTGNIAFKVIAMNEAWISLVATNWSSGTSTNIAATIG